MNATSHLQVCAWGQSHRFIGEITAREAAFCFTHVISRTGPVRPNWHVWP
jgi:hypothetical protein